MATLMPRWEHEVRVEASTLHGVRLVCACRWRSAYEREPTVSSLAQRAQDHRREQER